MTISRALAAVVVVLLAAVPALAFDPELTFKRGGFVLSLDGGGGAQNNLEKHERQTELDLWWIQGRASLLPFGTTGKDSFLYGAFEVGLEPIYQRYFHNTSGYFAGLGFGARYHFLSLGIFAPYVELGAAAGGTNLKVIEIDSSFAFRLYGGVGASVFVADNAAIYAGYRMVHISNGNISRPNRGFEADTGVLGVSFFFP
jgi:opacity protein-like surface antigen